MIEKYYISFIYDESYISKEESQGDPYLFFPDSSKNNIFYLPPLDLSNSRYNNDFDISKNIINVFMDNLLDKVLEETKNNINNKKHTNTEPFFLTPMKDTIPLNKKIINAIDEKNKEKNEDKGEKKEKENTPEENTISTNTRQNIYKLLQDIEKQFDGELCENKYFVGEEEQSVIPYNPDTPYCILDKKNIKDTPATGIEHKIEKINIDVEINSLSDILQLIKKYPLIENVEYNINMGALHKIKDPLDDLNNMIGMANLKNSIIDQIIYFVQDLHTISSKKNGDFMHTVIYGPPGTGKTEIARIMGHIFSRLGILKKGTFKKATRSDLVAGYLGQTSLKTRDLIKECLDGVLFIDEAYALGNPEKRDSFAKECIDTLCEALSDNKDRLMVIIAGYEDELQDCFFKYNSGLESRFTWRFKTDDYTAEELMDIFFKKVIDAGWNFQKKEEFTLAWFENNMDYFKYYGRDMETLFAKTKIAHSRRVFCKDKSEKTKITLADLDNGFKIYLSNDEVKNRKDKLLREKGSYAHMYL